ncbi:Lipid phosphate phosphatase [Entamoeba marina]
MTIPEGTNNVNVLYPSVSSTVPYNLCLTIAYVPTVICIILVAIRKKSLLVLVCSLLCLGCSAFCCNTITNMGKLFAGRPRPQFYDRINNGGQIDNAYKSFPSGHSSTIFNGLTYLSLLLAGQLKVFSSGMESWKIFIVIIPLIGAGAVAISRTRDYHHNFSDILGGSLIGIVLSLIMYYSKHQPLSSIKSDELKVMVELEKQQENELGHAELEEIDEEKQINEEKDVEMNIPLQN